MRAFGRGALFGMAAAFLAACGSGHPTLPFPAEPVTPNHPLGSAVIQHVVIIVQENRSFDHLFYGFPGADSQPGVAEDEVPLEAGQDVCHFHTSFSAAYDMGAMDGFDDEQLCGIVNGSYQPEGSPSHYMFAYVP